jgi:hypothetical protein
MTMLHPVVCNSTSHNTPLLNVEVTSAGELKLRRSAVELEMTMIRQAVCSSTLHNILPRFERTSQYDSVGGLQMYISRRLDTTPLCL